MSPLQLQGQVFCGVAILAAGIYWAVGSINPHLELLFGVALIASLGLPHGAADPLYARAIFDPKSILQWIAFVGIYLALSGLVVASWMVAPLAFLVVFLLISGFHFSADLAEDALLALRVLYGGAVIIFPTFFHFESVLKLFSLLVDASHALPISHALHTLAAPWLVAIGIAIVFQLRAGWNTALEAAAVTGLALALPPIPAFVLYFCGMHSARHFLRTQRFAKLPIRTIFIGCIAPTLAVLIALAVLWQFRSALSLDARIVQFTFVTLAALTVPHMVLVERVRFAGWDAGKFAPAAPANEPRHL
jgi:beta-carotene 15,15'-dioxygenase